MRMSVEEYKKLLKEQKKNKYSNEKTTIDGITFDSIKEANRYSELKILERAGLITDLKLQPEFILLPKQIDERAMYYKADFSYTEKDGTQVVEDAKGFKTKVYKLKRKLFKYQYPNFKFIES